MRRRNTCAGMFRDWNRTAPVIGKVLRGRNAQRLLYYLCGPGQAKRAHRSAPGRRVQRPGGTGTGTPSRRNAGLPANRRAAGTAAGRSGRAGYAQAVWHCAVRAATGGPDAVGCRMGPGRSTDHAPGQAGARGRWPGGRWVAVRHAADHIHLVATLARQDGTRPRIWNNYYRVREACHDACRIWLRSTAPADRTATRRPTRAETEQAPRRGWAEPARVTLRREVCTAAAGAGSEREFFARLAGWRAGP